MSLRSPAVIALAALLVAAILYAPVAEFPFLYDDNKQILANENIQGWHGFARAFSVPLWSFDEWKGGGRHYRPLYSIWFTVNWLLFGDEPAGWHLLCVLLHAVVVIAVWFLGTELGVSRPAAALAAAFFALHPINIQAVAWISASTDTIAAVCVLASCVAWVRASSAKKTSRLLGAAAVAFFTMAALTLERAWPCVVLPALFLWLRDRNRFVNAGIGFVLPMAAVLIVRALVLTDYRGVASTELPGIATSLATAPLLFLRYLQNILLPSTLSLAYPEIAGSAGGIRFVLGLLAATVAAAAAAVLSKGRPRRQFLALAAASTFLPVLYADFLRASDLVQDRYVYLPLAFGSLWLADVAADAWSRGRHWQIGTGAAGLVWMSVLVVFFRPNLVVWSHELALYERATELAPENPAHLMNLSIAQHRLDPEADADCELLLRAQRMRAMGKPGANDVILAFNTGNCHRDHGRQLAAIAEYERADRLSNGKFHPARRNLAATMVNAELLTEALEVAESLRRDFPQAGWSERLRGTVLARMERYADAEVSFRRAIELDPGDEKSRVMLRIVRARQALQPISPR